MNDIQLSKRMSYALRHAPDKFGITLDKQGWVDLELFVSSLKREMKWKRVEKKDIIRVVENCDKKRYEIDSGKIRAIYGHSVAKKIDKVSEEPPEKLYHGTAKNVLDLIKEKGLLPQGRQYVHLSVDKEMAIQVGKRRDSAPTIIAIKSKEAWNEGTKFYKGNDRVWLADSIESKYLEIP